MRTEHKICVVISGPSFDQAREQIHHSLSYAALFEFRLDLLKEISIDDLLKLRLLFAQPLLLTIRQTLISSREALRELISIFNPKYIDLEFDTPSQIFLEIQKAFPKIEIICSTHDYKSTPLDLEHLFQQMLSKPAHIYKLATTATSTLDAMRMLQFVKLKNSQGYRFLGMCMGLLGQITRLLGPICGNFITYACPDKNSLSAPGQFDLQTLIEIYHHHTLSAKTRIYGLIGDPVEQSLSHLTHNQVFRKLEEDAIYIKMVVQADELETFLILAQNLNFSGLSVTMPLKEKILALVNHENLDSVNTVKFTADGMIGYNTDGMGAVNALKQFTTLINKKVIILGAGGSAKAIVRAILKEGANLIVLNRTKSSLNPFKDRYGCPVDEITHFPKYSQADYDILINCTSVGMGSETACPIDTEALLSKKLVMDIISSPKNTALLKAAQKKECQIVYGREMFCYQAVGQFKIWISPDIEKDIEDTLKEGLCISK